MTLLAIVGALLVGAALFAWLIAAMVRRVWAKAPDYARALKRKADEIEKAIDKEAP